MGCTFCATGQMGYTRQLSADEIFEQAPQSAAISRHQPSAAISRYHQTLISSASISGDRRAIRNTYQL
jgi:adenine C2-methylase RlmN of 23S rRNA A2503 and tRNA A37